MAKFYKSTDLIAWVATVLSAFFLVVPVVIPWLRRPYVWVRRLSLSGPLLVLAYNVLYDQGDMSSDSAAGVAWLILLGFNLPWLFLTLTRGFFGRGTSGWLMGLSYGAVLWGFSSSALYIAIREQADDYTVILLVIGLAGIISFGLGAFGYKAGVDDKAEKNEVEAWARDIYDIVSRAATGVVFSYYTVLGVREIVRDDDNMAVEMNRAETPLWYSIIFLGVVLHVYFISVQGWLTEKYGYNTLPSKVQGAVEAQGETFAAPAEEGDTFTF